MRLKAWCGVASALVALTTLLASAEGALAARPGLSLTGSGRAQTEICGEAVQAVTVPAGGAASVTLRPPRARVHALILSVERCEDARWVPVSRQRLRKRRRAIVRRLDTAEDGDFRIRARLVGEGGRSAVRYLRVGVGEIVDVPVGFDVRNINRSEAPCLTGTDGKEYVARGHLVGPRSMLTGDPPRAITVYLHGAIMGEELWHFTALAGYNHLLHMARLGHVSLSFSQLGYHPSGLPHGYDTCVGADADVAHQIIGRLRSADYVLAGQRGPAFRRIALAGLSGGALRAPVEAFSFNDVDALVLMGIGTVFSHSNYSGFILPLVPGCLPPDGSRKRAGDGSERQSNPGGYTDYDTERGTATRGNRLTFFYNADPAVQEAVLDRVEQDPCGGGSALAQTIAVTALRRPTVSVPVLIINGDHDGAVAPGSAQEQRLHYAGSRDVMAVELENTGHLLMFERTAPIFRAELSEWLAERGF